MCSSSHSLRWLVLASVAWLSVAPLSAQERADYRYRDPQGAKWADALTRERVTRVNKQLGVDEFSKREEASNALAEIGVPAFDQLDEAARSAADLEVRRRSEGVIAQIERGSSEKDAKRPGSPGK